MKTSKRFLMLMLTLLPLSFCVHPVQAQGNLTYTITIDSVKPPQTCTVNGWRLPYERTFTVNGIAPHAPIKLSRYVVQYVNDELNLVHYWGSGYDAYVQDYMNIRGKNLVYGGGGYTVPLVSNSYHATTIEYILQEDAIVAEVRQSIECLGGVPINYAITGQTTTGVRSQLPKPNRNLVLALEDVPIYRNRSYWDAKNVVGIIKTCQTFFISEIEYARASILIYARESFSNNIIIIGGLPRPHTAPRLVDVAENYGQPDGQPILAECIGK